jgi:hypothetical protein
MASVKPPYNSVNPQHNVEVFLGSNMISIYSTNGSMAYQCGNRRALVDAKGCTFFQKQVNGHWVNGRHSYALDLIAKVKAALA